MFRSIGVSNHRRPSHPDVDRDSLDVVVFMKLENCFSATVFIDSLHIGYDYMILGKMSQQ